MPGLREEEELKEDETKEENEPMAKDLKYPIYCGQSLMKESIFRDLTFHVNGRKVVRKIEFKPYQSVLLKINRRGKVEEVDITFVPKDPEVRPREVQKSWF